MKKAVVFILVGFTCGLILKAQPHKEKMEAMKIAFITKELNLTPAEAQTFWPVYNARQDELMALRKDRKAGRMEVLENFNSMSEQEIEESVQAMFSIQVQEVEINKKYHEQFKKVLPLKKVGQLYITEKKFRRIILEELQNRREGGGPGGGPKGPRPNGGGGPHPGMEPK